jgi:hypothetical protein
MNTRKTKAKYIISSLCFGDKYLPILDHWMKNTIEKCPSADIIIPAISLPLPFPPDEVQYFPQNKFRWNAKGEAFWDVLRLENNIEYLIKYRKPVVHCDLDMIIVKNLDSLIEWGKRERFDIIFSRETWGDPLPICSGLYILYPSSQVFCKEIWLTMMKLKKYGTYSDQNTLRFHALDCEAIVTNVSSMLDGIEYKNTIVSLDNMRICILDMEIITRDPMGTKTQYANHVNVDNVGGVNTFLRFFNEKIENLPLTCRCGKSHLGNTEICQHFRRKN